MALRLGEYVVYGELRNKRNLSTHGIIVLRGPAGGEDRVVHLELTGNCDPDLHGKAFRFWPNEADPTDAIFTKDTFPRFQDGQIGPTGTMTAQDWVRTISSPVEEFLQHAKLGEPLPTEWKRRLYLEWFSQNGRVVIEMAGPVIEECTREAESDDDEGDWVPLPNLAPHPDTIEAPPASPPEITEFHREQDRAEGEGTIPNDLERELEAEADAIDRAIRGEHEDEGARMMAEHELMDYAIDHEERQPVASLFEDPAQFPRPEDLSDEAVEAQLKVLLMQLAMKSVALDVCKHFTARDAYRLLVDRLLTEEKVHAILTGTGWVQHMMTHEYCPDCEAEADERLAAEDDGG